MPGVIDPEANLLFVDYDFWALGRWVFEIGPEKGVLERV
jgi:hypothetical protein